MFGYTEEGMRWFRAFLERADDAPPLLRAPALRSFASSAHFSGDFELAERLCEESLAIYEQEKNEHGIAVLLHRLSISALEHGDVQLARDRAERSLVLHRRLVDDKGACQPLSLLGALALQAGEVERGVALLEERLGVPALFREGLTWRDIRPPQDPEQAGVPPP